MDLAPDADWNRVAIDWQNLSNMPRDAEFVSPAHAIPPKNDPAEWDRWNSIKDASDERKESWDPQRQSKILDCLEGLVEQVE